MHWYNPQGVLQKFPFLLGRAFIEAPALRRRYPSAAHDFPSFSEGLSLRDGGLHHQVRQGREFPFLLGRAFIEGAWWGRIQTPGSTFPFLFERAFIEARPPVNCGILRCGSFPFFWEGLSLRLSSLRAAGALPLGFPFLFGRAFIEARTSTPSGKTRHVRISLPFWRGFH